MTLSAGDLVGRGGAEFLSPVGLPVQVRAISLPAEVTISIKTVTAAQVTQGLPALSPCGSDAHPPRHVPWYRSAWLGVPDLAESAHRDPNCLLMSVNIALLFKTKWGVFCLPCPESRRFGDQGDGGSLGRL